MKAVILDSGGPAVVDIDLPEVGPGQVLVRARAACLNRADLLMINGAYHGGTGGAGARLGLEWAGEIIAIGTGVEGWTMGARVMGSGAGAFSEFVLAYAAFIYPVPDTLSFEEAACLPVALQTTHDAIATNGRLRPGQSMLVQGASSGVGLMALQVGRLLGAGTVIGTSTKPANLPKIKQFGATSAVNTRDADWADQVLDVTEGKGVDLVIDQLAGPLINETMRATALGGRIVNVGRMAGEAGTFDFDLHSTRRIEYIGVTFRTRTPAEIKLVVDRTKAALTKSVFDGTLRLPVDSVYPINEIQLAFDKMSFNGHFGKIVISI